MCTCVYTNQKRYFGIKIPVHCIRHKTYCYLKYLSGSIRHIHNHNLSDNNTLLSQTRYNNFCVVIMSILLVDKQNQLYNPGPYTSQRSGDVKTTSSLTGIFRNVFVNGDKTGKTLKRFVTAFSYILISYETVYESLKMTLT